MRKFSRLLAATVILLCFCKGNKNPVSFGYGRSDFAIYFLADENLKMKDVYNKDMSELKLAPRPWLDADDIRFYDWSSHCIYLKKDKYSFIPGYQKGEQSLFPDEWANRPLVAVADGHKCYPAYFNSLLLSDYHFPAIVDLAYNSAYPADILYIQWDWLYKDNPQDHETAKSALSRLGLFHGGISVTFDTTDVNTIRVLNNSDISTISYKFTLTNNDIDDLYVPDPDKMGSGLFHHFTNGVVFKNIATYKTYMASQRTVDPIPSPDYWSPDWYTKMPSGTSLQRTVILKGYPHFSEGEYMFQFRYGGQIRGMEKEVREATDGRYWLGPTRSNILIFNYAEGKSNVKAASNFTKALTLTNQGD